MSFYPCVNLLQYYGYGSHFIYFCTNIRLDVYALYSNDGIVEKVGLDL